MTSALSSKILLDFALLHFVVQSQTYLLLQVSLGFNRPEILENSSVGTGLEKVSFHFNPKERQCQRMFKLPYNCTYFTC